MSDYKAAFLAHLDQEGLKYTDLDEHAVRISFNAENLTSVAVICYFDQDSNTVQLDCHNIARFTEEKLMQGMMVCNSLNDRYRWVKFYLDKDNDVRCQLDAYLDLQTAGKETLSLVMRMVHIVDEGYPQIMKSLWA